jgi:aspartyl-tRNA(Asn)/glutamyl-tRNA(Gln) amidotransferase subunit C
MTQSAAANAGGIDGATMEALLFLSRLSPESIDLPVLQGQANDIVGYFGVLRDFAGGENPYDAYPTTTAGALRGEAVQVPLETRGIKNLSADFLDGYIQVPKVLGEGV